MPSVSSFESAYSEDIETKEWKRKTYSYSLKATLLCHPSPTSTNTHAFFSVFLFLFFDLSLPPTPPLPRLSVTQNKYHLQNTVKKYYYQVIVLGYCCRVIFSKTAHFPNEKNEMKMHANSPGKETEDQQKFWSGYFLKKIWMERWN